MATWDVFRSERLEVERSLSTAAVRAALARGELHDDDLARPAGTTLPWTRLTDIPALIETPLGPDDEPAVIEKETDEVPYLREAERSEQPPAAAPHAEDRLSASDLPTAPTEEFEGPSLDEAEALGEFDIDLEPADRTTPPESEQEADQLAWDEVEEEPYDPQEEDEEAAEFTLSRSALQHVEELDLAAMVDVAFQMVLFFMVTAATVLFKTLEVPRTPPEAPPASVAQGQQPKTLDDLMKNDYIVVEINPQGEIRIDHEPATPESLVERLRQARTNTGRTAMLLAADFTTPHRNAVMSYDAANEIGLRIAIAKPASPNAPPPPPAVKNTPSG